MANLKDSGILEGNNQNIIAILFLVIIFLYPVRLYCSEELKSGDLIFQVEGKGDFSKAIADATGAGDSLKMVHLGIIEITESGEIDIIEASPHKGVCITPYKEFINSSEQINGEPGVIVKRLAIEFPIVNVITKAKEFIGEPYDWWYLPDNGKMYCSELVYESYYDKSGNRIFKSSPMNFRALDGSMPQFWIDLFSKLNMEVPEGVEGTNPQDIFKDPRLIEVLRLF